MAKRKTRAEVIHYIIVLLVFAITGSTAAYVSKLIMPATGLKGGTALYIIVYILLITPIYQVLLLGYAWLFGKYAYFLEKQKKLGRKLLQWAGLRKSNKNMKDDSSLIN